MKLLFSSYAFPPSVGGIETVSAILAEKFVAAGHEIELITETPGDDGGKRGYRVTRCPALKRLIELIRWADLLFQNNISLRSLLPALLLRKRSIVVHQTWIRNTKGRIAWNDFLKRIVSKLVTNIAISRAVADDVGRKCIVIPNPYRDDLFRIIPETPRNKTLVFLGRLVSDKGVDLLLRAMRDLRRDGLRPDLTIIGSGPETQNLLWLSRELQLKDQIVFAGKKSGEELVQLLNAHRIMVVPSRWAEPFGVVALEGIACGCAIIGSQSGGLKEAMGPCGITFENGNAQSLTDALKRVLSDSAFEESLRNAGPAHLVRFKAREVARAYLQLMEQAAP
jgi:glycogen synthase